MKNLAMRSWYFTAVLLIPLLAGCGSGNGSSGGNIGQTSGITSTTSGSAQFTYNWLTMAVAKTRQSAQVNSVVVAMNGQQLQLQAPTSSVTFTNLAAGSMGYTVTSYGSFGGLGTVLGTASGVVSITAQQTTSVTIASGYTAPSQLAVSTLASAMQVAAGSTLQLQAAAETFQNQVVLLPPNTSFTWGSSNTAVATVSAAGLVTGVRAGSVNIIATLPNSGVPITRSVAVTVTGGTQPAELNKIAFVSTRDGNYQLYLTNPDGSGVARVESTTSQDNAPSLNMQTGQLVFASYRNNNWGLYLINEDGSGLTALTKTSTAEFAPAWSPDGSTIACDVWQTGSIDSTGAPVLQTLQGIELINVATGAGSMLVTGGMGACWSPDGSQIAYSNTLNNNCISVINVSTRVVQQLTVPPSTNTLDIHPNWSHDGSLITFEREVTSPNPSSGYSNIYTVSTASQHTVTELTTTGQEHQPCWSPDDSQIVFSSLRSGTTEGYIMSATGAGAQLLTNNSSLNLPYSWEQW